tara:strand:- start:1551 stop:1982 length:432 start_codon:yes stop_codon:yes gene_type:complete
MPYVYLLRSYLHNGSDDIFKIGKSLQNDFRRLSNYGSERVVFRVKMCSDPEIINEVERNLISSFRNEFDLYAGNEYFKGSLIEMIKLFDEVCNDYEMDPYVWETANSNSYNNRSSRPTRSNHMSQDDLMFQAHLIAQYQNELI